MKLEINKRRLDRDWIEQPRMMQKACEELADAQEALDKAEANLELVEAEVKKEVRSKPKEFGLDKVTEDAIKQEVILSERYQKATRRVIRSKHDVGVHKALVTALDHRKKALEGLVYLHGQSYFATPTVNGVAGEEMELERKRRIRRGG